MTWKFRNTGYLFGITWHASCRRSVTLMMELSIFTLQLLNSGRVSDSGARGRGFETYRRRVVSLSKTLYSPKVLVNCPGSSGSVPTWLKHCWLGRKASTQTKQLLNIHKSIWISAMLSSREYRFPVASNIVQERLCFWSGKSNLNRNMTKPTKWVCAQPKLRSAWASAQTDQSLRCPHEETSGP